MVRAPGSTALKVAAQAAAFLGSERFQHRYRPVRDRNRLFGWALKDVADGGDTACAAFVSHVLRRSRLLSRSRSTVHTMLNAMEQHGWEPAAEAVLGGVALWGFHADVEPGEGETYGHSGICVADGLYVSHSSIIKAPAQHGPVLSDGRLPVAYYTHEALVAAS